MQIQRQNSKFARAFLSPSLAVLGVLCGAGLAHASGVNVTITADNAYSFGYGTGAGLNLIYGNVENCYSADIFLCSTGPETYLNVPSGANNYLYIVAYSDNSGTQGVLAQFVSGVNTVYTGTSAWQVYATGIDIDPNCSGTGGPNGPSLATINTEIGKANINTGGPGSSVGWVGVAGGATGTVGTLAIGEANDSASGTFPVVCNTMIGSAARWMWYNPDPSQYTNPFASPAPPGEFLIFRLPTSQVTNPKMVGVNKDLQNDTGTTVTGVDILIEGHHPPASDIFHGSTPIFTVVQQGPNDLLRWSGGNIPTGSIIHVGFKLQEENVTILGVTWTNNGTFVGCAHQLNTHYHLLGTQDVRYDNSCLSCEAIPLYAGNFQLEYYENEVDLAAMNSTTPRFPMATDTLLLAPQQVLPGSDIGLTVPPAPAGARWVILVYTVSADAQLAGPGNTVDWIQFAAQTNLDLSPAVIFCEPSSGGVIACPCSNPPLGPARGCDNSSATGGASLAASGSASLSADTLVFSTADEKPTATSIVLQGSSASSGLIFGQGVRCVAGSLKRLYVKHAVGGSISAPAGADPTVSARSAALGDSIGAGQHRYYLVYYRDPTILGGCSAIASFNCTTSADVAWN
jgi:hypothetical protein